VRSACTGHSLSWDMGNISSEPMRHSCGHDQRRQGCQNSEGLTLTAAPGGARGGGADSAADRKSCTHEATHRVSGVRFHGARARCLFLEDLMIQVLISHASGAVVAISPSGTPFGRAHHAKR
jgi:hypothetical protein